MKKEPKVLMFGWEFPPVISGGLGVACLGLCKALAPYTQLKMIIPKSVPGFRIPHIDLIGLSNFSKAELEIMFKSESSVDIEKFEYATGSLNPYMSSFGFDQSITDIINQVFYGEIQPFQIESLYSGDVIRKVLEFTRIAVQYSLQQDFDIIHAHDWLTFLPAMMLKIKTGKPMVLHVHSLEYDRAGEHSKNWVFELEQKAMSLADRIIPVSRYTGTICEKYYQVPAQRITPVHNGVEYINRTMKNNNLPDKMVIFFGRITMQKGPEYFVEAARTVLAHHPNVKFIMAGSGDMYTPLVHKIAEYGMGDKFHFTGFLNKQLLNELLAIADVYCMPSVSEPFGLSAVEAVQYGIPVIMSKTSGAGEVLNSALKIDFWDTHKMAQYIIACLDYAGIRKAVVDRANDDLQQVTWENAAHKVMNIYHEIAN